MTNQPWPDIIGLLPVNPFRPLDWRWRRAGQLLIPRARRRRWDDAGVIRARAFLKALAKAHGDVRRPRLARDHADVLGAYGVRRGSPRRAWEVEARLMAGQTDREIGDRVGAPTGVVGAYEMLFFSIRHRLGSPDWVTAMALGPRLYEGLGPGDHGVFGKLMAYRGGPLVLDAWLDSTAGGGGPAPLGMAEDFGLLFAVMTTPETDEDAAGLIRLEALARRIGRANDDDKVAAVTGPVLIVPLDAPIGPPTMPIGAPVRAQGGPKPAETDAEDAFERVIAAG